MKPPHPSDHRFLPPLRCTPLLALVAMILCALPRARADILYVSFSGQNKIEKFSSTGSDLGLFATTGVSSPKGVAFDSAGDLDVANFGNSVIEELSPTGANLGAFATLGVSNPQDLAVDSAGNLYVVNSDNIIEKYSSTGADLGHFATTGINGPDGLAFDSAGNLYVANQGNNTIEKYSPGGTPSLFAATGAGSGPIGLAFDRAGNLYSTYYIANKVEKFSSTGSDLGTFATTDLNLPQGLAFDSAGDLFVASTDSSSIEEFSSAGTHLASLAGSGLTGPQFLAVTNNAGQPLPLPPVPEPGSAMLLGFSLPALLGTIRWRRRTASEMKATSLPMTYSPRWLWMGPAVFLATLLGTGCHRQEGTPAAAQRSPQGQYHGPDHVREEIDAFRYQVRGYYNSSNFNALENSVAEVRAGPLFLGNGGAKLFQFYDALQCRSSEPESMWELHERIHENWEKACPQSITARVAHANFMIAYAWHARGSGYADTVAAEGWRLFAERLATARKILEDSKEMTPQCPMWWSVEMTLARGQDWSNADFRRAFAEAKQVAPQFWNYDVSAATYLLPRWHGQEGDWEKAAAAEMQRPEGLGAEGYAHVVRSMLSYYDNIFRESQASWPNTRAGFEQLRQKYPESLGILTDYCLLACLAEDRPLAQTLFQQLNGYVDDRCWGQRYDYNKYHAWAFSGKAL